MTRILRSHFVMIMLTALLLASALMATACDTSQSGGQSGGGSGSGDDQPVHNVKTTREIKKELARIHTEFDTLLSKIVNEKGLVRYRLLLEAENATLLADIVKGYKDTKLPNDTGDRLALWCNAYNANVLSMIVNAQDPSYSNLGSVQEIAGFFEVSVITVAGEEMTLNELENMKIRPLGDPRIHAALVCAAVACPPLRSEAYRAAKLDLQFDDQCRRWVNDPARFRLHRDKILYMSQILIWYGEDFRGAPFYGEVAFVRKYVAEDSDIARLLAREDEPWISFMAYDWSLNDAQE